MMIGYDDICRLGQVRVVWDKYGVSLIWEHMRALHRTRSGGIIFSLYSRMPGALYESLIRVINSNPNRNIRVYVNIQLMEPFDMLFYIARKLKQQKLISYYRLDDNGYTWLSLSDQHNTYKFTSFNQLDLLGLDVPEALKKEMAEYSGKKMAREKEEGEKNLARAREVRPGVGRISTNSSLCPTVNVTGGNTEPMGSRPPRTGPPPPVRPPLHPDPRQFRFSQLHSASTATTPH